MLSDGGQIHPGPTIYDSFWVRDSSVEGIACALGGDQNLAEQQFGRHYPGVFAFDYERLGPVSTHGFFGGEHEKTITNGTATVRPLGYRTLRPNPRYRLRF
jgi:hypothetical protein